MNDTAIRVDGLGKRYRIGGRQDPYKRFTEVVMDTLAAPLHRLRQLGSAPPPEEIFWALQDVSFEVQPGEVLGVIGANGAGKSTLLKILSRITEPTRGEVELRGRVGSLLEVGTGFHPELTGRENIFLNGAILGMGRQEIRHKFDAIVNFAEIENFLDTPVKRYSSGMYVRLAFAVAAHLEPEILLVDEVLAVGDMQFQEKCLGKMDDVSKSGRTILFVSHNLGAIERLTHRCLLLAGGRAQSIGPTHEVLEEYYTGTRAGRAAGVTDLTGYRRPGSGQEGVQITRFGLDPLGEGLPTLSMGAPLVVDLEISCERSLGSANVLLKLKNARNDIVALLFSPDDGVLIDLEPGTQRLRCCIEDLWLPPGSYVMDVGINRGTRSGAYDVLCDVPVFDVTNLGQVQEWTDRPWGVVHPKHVAWQKT